MLPRPIFILFSALLWSLPQVMAADKETLRTRLEAGRVYTLETELAGEMRRVTDGQAAEPVQASTIRQRFVMAVEGEEGTDRKRMKVLCAELQAKTAMRGEVMSYDSRDPAKSPPLMQQMFGAVVGRPFVLVYDRDDKFVEVAEAEEVEATPLGDGRALSGKQLAGLYQKSLERLLPEDAVAEGDEWAWEDAVEMPPLGSVLIRGKGTYAARDATAEGAQAKLVLKGQIANPPGTAEQKVAFGEGGGFSGEVTFDLGKRWVTRSEVTLALKLWLDGQEVEMKQRETRRLVSVGEE